MTNLLAELAGSRYIGDGVYVKRHLNDPSTVWLLTSNGLTVTNKIALEADVLDKFISFISEK